MTNFKILKEIGEGGFGIVYLVESTNDQKKYALKQIEYENIPIKDKERIIQEIEIIRMCSHDNIIKIYGLSKSNTSLNILMEYADNGDLFNYIEKYINHPIPEQDIINIFVQVCMAVKYIHDRKIIHRDIKPENIFLCKNGMVKLGDFGFARLLDSTISKVNSGVGTPYYISPEICNGNPYSAPSDIWSLGCVLYVMCKRKLPFYGESIPEIMNKIKCCKVTPISNIYSPDIKNLIKSIFQIDPRKRPTINQILSLPIFRYKMMELLGRKTYESEMSHGVFHEQKPGTTPPQYIKDIKININS